MGAEVGVRAGLNAGLNGGLNAGAGAGLGTDPGADPNPCPGTGWFGQLQLRYTSAQGRTRAWSCHQGPLRVLRALYPEGESVCHHVLVHPPGGVVGGDRLEVHAQLASGSHALITTPGATRFYRSGGRTATQAVRLEVAAGARLEWLPLETIAHPGCEATNQVIARLQPGAEMIGWDVLALGLPHSGQGFAAGPGAAGGWFQQHLELPGVWLERGRIGAGDALLQQSRLGWAGNTVMASLWFAGGQGLAAARLSRLLELAREAAQTHALAATAGCTSPHAQLLVLRVLSPGVEAALQLLQAVRAAWRLEAWGLPASTPRIWRL